MYNTALLCTGFTFQLAARRLLIMPQVVISALYHFVILENFKELRSPLLDLMLKNDIKGTILLAREGINGTVAGSQVSIDILLAWLTADSRLAELRHKESYDDTMPFYRTRVKLKKEIVTMGVEGIDPNHVVGSYVKPEDWNDLISDPEEKLCNAFEVIKEKNMYGRKYMGIERSTFVFDTSGKLRYEIRKVKVKNHIDEVLELVKSL